MRIVVISGFAAERLALEELLRGDGHDVRSAASRAAGLREVVAICPDVVIADTQVPGLDGLSLVEALAGCGRPRRVILLCPRTSRALESHDVVCLTKPIELAELRWHLAHGRRLEARA